MPLYFVLAVCPMSPPMVHAPWIFLNGTPELQPLTDVLILGPVPQEMSSESSLSPLLQQQKNKSEIANEELHKIISSVQINPTPERVLHPVPSNYSDYDNSHTTSNLTAALQAGLGWQYLPHRGGEDRVITLQAMPLSLPNLSDSSGLTRWYEFPIYLVPQKHCFYLVCQ